MEDIQQNIILALDKFFEQNQNKVIGDKEIASSLNIDIDRIRVGFEDLQNLSRL